MTADGPIATPPTTPPDAGVAHGRLGADDQRAMGRPSLRIRVTDKGARSATAIIGYTRDASMDGCFLCTSLPLRVGDLLPVTLSAAPGPDIDANMEVVRVTSEGAGLRIRTMAAEDRRRFRKLVAQANSVTGTREAVERVLDAERRTTTPIADPGRIRTILNGAAGATVRVVAADQNRMWEGTLEGLRGEALTVRMPGAPTAGTPLFVVLDHAHVNYAFTSMVLEIAASGFTMRLPDQLGYAERRSRERMLVDDAELTLPLPGIPTERASFRVIEVGEGGFSFEASADRWLMPPGSALVSAVLRDHRGSRDLDHAVVSRVDRLTDNGGGDRTVRVGVALGQARQSLVPERRVIIGGWHQRLLARVGDLLGVASARLARLRPLPSPAPPVAPVERTVHFQNRDGLQIVGLLDGAEPTPGAHPASMPLVLVVPGFAGRKEQMSQLATTLIESFRRQHADIAVLRIDGTNNLGESEKDPGNAVDGKHTLGYRLSGVESDILGALDWCQNNDRVRPTSIILVSVSFAACAVMHLLAREDVQRRFPEIGLWVSYMGAPEPRDAILHVSGHHDAAAIGEDGAHLVTLIGCLVEGRAFWQDAKVLDVGTLLESERDMAKVAADVLWIAGAYDGWMDLGRVSRVMEVTAPGKRRLIVADTGHVPKSGREAQRQFALITQEIWSHVHKSTLAEWYPPLHRLRAREQAEWHATRRTRPEDAAAFWRRYLLAEGLDAPRRDEPRLGFDILAWYPSYREFIDGQADALTPSGLEVLELGAGTGNLTHALVCRHAKRVVALDLVPEALARLREKVPGVETHVVNLEGSPTTAMRRFVAGDIRTFTGLRGRVPISPDLLARLDQAGDPRIYAAACGRTVDLRPMVRAGELTEDALAALARLTNIRDEPGGIPFADASFDRVGMSLVLSYLQHPDDALFEIRRVLRPAGELVISSMVRDADTSSLFRACVAAIQAAPEAAFGEAGRGPMLEAARHMLDASGELFRLEEEGYFRFYGADELADRLVIAGFEVLDTWTGFGSPGQAICLRCRRRG